jgi:Effector Associated Constant Component 1
MAGGTMPVTLTLSGEAGSADELRSLRTFLLGEPSYRGRVTAVERPAAAGTLGPVLESLQVALGSGAGVFGSVLIAWIRSRAGKCTVHVKREDGREFILTHTRVRTVSAAEIAELSEQLDRFVSSGD